MSRSVPSQSIRRAHATVAVVSALCALLTACSGGGGDDNDDPPTPSSDTTVDANGAPVNRLNALYSMADSQDTIHHHKRFFPNGRIHLGLLTPQAEQSQCREESLHQDPNTHREVGCTSYAIAAEGNSIRIGSRTYALESGKDKNGRAILKLDGQEIWSIVTPATDGQPLAGRYQSVRCKGAGLGASCSTINMGFTPDGRYTAKRSDYAGVGVGIIASGGSGSGQYRVSAYFITITPDSGQTPETLLFAQHADNTFSLGERDFWVDK